VAANGLAVQIRGCHFLTLNRPVPDPPALITRSTVVRLVLGWVTTGESLMLYVFAALFSLLLGWWVTHMCVSLLYTLPIGLIYVIQASCVNCHNPLQHRMIPSHVALLCGLGCGRLAGAVSVEY